jgi:hypothetical protein
VTQSSEITTAVRISPQEQESLDWLSVRQEGQEGAAVRATGDLG